MYARHRLAVNNLAGTGWGEGRENRPRSRHCERPAREWWARAAV